MKKYIILVILSIFSTMSWAQQDAMYTQYMFNTLAINPAYAGSRNVISATALYRNQWTGIDGAPRTGTLTVDAPIMNKRLGIGFQVFSDKLGVTQTTGGSAALAYRIRLEKGSLAFGIQTSMSHFNARYSSISLGGNQSFDPAFVNDASKVLFNVGTGVYYNSDKFYLGLSAQDLLTNKLNNSGNGDALQASQVPHLFLTAGYVFPLSSDFKLKPSFLIKGVKGAPIEADLNASLWIKDVLAIGAGYRSSADIAALLEVQATPQLRFGYSYDRSTTQLRNFNSGSHEIMLRYEFGFERNKIISPRFF
ncbi:type IX secretion system membrane protein PorP/SprF [Pedobacter sp. MC2016-05]|uniref:PorP/SprF family type IX secretion system membrane protein n=1 Tax=Pedobacter sp. MC2016-05 TaxID=2994474 RepID=UPI0022461F41|nr:type IX secretion system membrane protein PorP/SprF [Pedobacter sp. MC2016-05]MCX2473200.1 type IX secretion system membrane protein PorP/SprF [Pedobacter sp. MC2016-05]